MNRLYHPTDNFIKIIVFGEIVSVAIILCIFYFFTHNMLGVVVGLLIAATLFLESAAFLFYFKRRALKYNNAIFNLLDSMIAGDEIPNINLNEDTYFSKISYQINRLYKIIQENRTKIENEKKELQSLISDISHQLKTPITNLKILNDTLITRSMSNELKNEFLQISNNQLDKLDFLIQSLLKISQLEVGIITLNKTETPLLDTLTTSINSVLALIERKKIDFSVKFKETDQITFSHDKRWTSEAINNLLDNAIKYSEIGGTVQINVDKLEMYIKIDIIDFGIGISENKQGAIFNRFYREKSVQNIEGTGIGLFLTREIISRQGGYIQVNSKVNEGSTFSIFLPLK